MTKREKRPNAQHVCPRRIISPSRCQPNRQSDTHHRIYIKQPNAPRQSIQTKLKLCRSVLYACNAFSGEPTKLFLQPRCASCPSIKVARLHYDKYISNVTHTRSSTPRSLLTSSMRHQINDILADFKKFIVTSPVYLLLDNVPILVGFS